MYSHMSQYQSLSCINCDKSEPGEMTVFHLKPQHKNLVGASKKNGFGAVCKRHKGMWYLCGSKLAPKTESVENFPLFSDTPVISPVST
eukprot:UN00102